MSAGLIHFNRRQNYVEFRQGTRFLVRAASTANVDIDNDLENGDSFGGITLSTNDIILVKDQTNPEENGIYEVQASGTALRHASYDDADELTHARAEVTEGTHARTEWFQQNELNSLLDAQTWSTDPVTFNWVVPGGVNFIDLDLLSGGGGGGRGANGNDGGDRTGGGGAGGAGSQRFPLNGVPVNPGETITIQPGRGGLTRGDGTDTVLTGSFGTIRIPGSERGANGGNTTIGAKAAGGNSYIGDVLIEFSGTTYGPSIGGDGGETQQQSPTGTGEAGDDSPSKNIFCDTPATGGSPGIGGGYVGSGGGGGGCGVGPGGDGGQGGRPIATAVPSTPGEDSPSDGGGGGGGGGGGEIGSQAGSEGGRGGDGRVILGY